MSKKLHAAIHNGNVSVKNRRGVEVLVWYRNKNGERRTVIIPPMGIVEIAPRLTEAKMLQWSSLKDAVRRGDLDIL